MATELQMETNTKTESVTIKITSKEARLYLVGMFNHRHSRGSFTQAPPPGSTVCSFDLYTPTRQQVWRRCLSLMGYWVMLRPPAPPWL